MPMNETTALCPACQKIVRARLQYGYNGNERVSLDCSHSKYQLRCCQQATLAKRGCVCAQETDCPVHGNIHLGTHD